jgi:hypothetical protein
VAQFAHAYLEWISAGPGYHMAPGEIHHYSFHEYATVQEAVSISVRPHVNFLRSVLVVENVQGVTGSPVFSGTEFSVRNAGFTDVGGYFVSFGIIWT